MPSTPAADPFHRAWAFFAAHGISRLVRAVTDNGANYTATTFIRTVTASTPGSGPARPNGQPQSRSGTSGSSDIRKGSRVEVAGDQEHPEPIVVAVAVAAGDASVQ